MKLKATLVFAKVVRTPPLPPPQAHFLNTHAAIKKVISPACDVIAEEIRLNSVNRVYWTGL